MATIRDVAERALVSVGTVSRVLNDHPKVRPATKRAVLQAIEELGYRPNAMARNLRSSRTNVIGLLFHDLAQPMAIRSVRGAEEAARAGGYGVLVADSQGDSERQEEHILHFMERRADGLVVFPVGPRTPVVDAVSNAKGSIPTVLIGQTAAHKVLPTAVVDEVRAVDDAIRHLAELGHRRIAIVTSRTYTNQSRGRMFQTSLRRSGMETAPLVVVEHWPDAIEATRSLLSGKDRPTAIIAGTHGLAPWVIQGIRAAGCRVPDDVSMIAFGESDWAHAVEAPLSVIAVDFFAHTRDAVALLQRMLKGDESVPRTITHHSVYTPRGSTGPAPARS